MPWSEWSKEDGEGKERKKISWEHSHDLYDTIDGRGTCTTKTLCIILKKRFNIFLNLRFHDANKSFCGLNGPVIATSIDIFLTNISRKTFGYLNIPRDFIRFQSFVAIHPNNITPPNAIYTKPTIRSRKSMVVAICRLQVLTLLHLHLFGEIISLFSQ